MKRLDGQVVFLTGASRGIGHAIALKLAGAGAKVAAAARSEDALTKLCDKITSSGGTALPIKIDMKSEDSIKEALRLTNEKLGPIDIMINNAAILELSPIAQTPTELWNEVMSTNVTGVFIACREVLSSMIERKSGRIINVGSTAGRRGYEEQGAYCASKHALAGFTKVLAIETQSCGIRVHMLSPGGVLTGLSGELRASRGTPDDSPDWMTVDEIAEAALYLCSQTGAAFTDELILRRYASEPWR